MEEASCTLCKVALGRDDVRTVRGKNCGGRVCTTCAENANTALFPPKIGTAKVIGGSWDGLVAGAGHHNKGPLFLKSVAQLDAARAEYVRTSAFRPGGVLLVVVFQIDFIFSGSIPPLLLWFGPLLLVTVFRGPIRFASCR